ncbi:MAG: FAD-binding oxidoreductase, partial [Deltaproteobacteria bacterium]|nr:FAD-binding oxidoreductase [Deltaproteobacteria bacterium]
MQSAEAIAKELQRHLKGAVHGDELYRYMYSSDASIFKVVPLCVAMPRDAEDVLAAIDYARREGLPIIARGAGSSRCGQPLGEAIILDLSVHLNQVLEINPDQGYVRVQPGVVLADLNRALKPSGKFFAPDPSSGDWCTLGGMIANNASGAHTGKYGTTKRHVLALDAVLANGQAFRTQRLAWDGPELARLRAERSREGEIYRGVAALLEAHQVRLQARRPQVRKDVCGYNLYEVRENGAFDLSQLLVGSEGTLAVVTEAMLRILDLPKAKALALVTFDRLEAVGPAVCQLLEWGASMMEFVEATLLAIARKGDPALDAFLPRDLECALIVEFDGAERAQVEEQIRRMEHVLVGELGLASAVKPAP